MVQTLQMKFGRGEIVIKRLATVSSCRGFAVRLNYDGAQCCVLYLASIFRCMCLYEVCMYIRIL